MMPKLFIYIPTFNRHDLVMKQLEILSSEIDGRDNVRILISENPSGSAQSVELEAACRANPRVQFRRNLGNYGGNANFLLGFCEAQSDEVLWLLADDTEVRPGAIDYIFSKLDSEIAFYGFSVPQDDPELRLPNQMGESLDKLIVWNDIGIDRLISKTSWGGITSALYDMNYFKDFVEFGFTFYNSSFPHLAIFLSALKKNSQMTIRLLPLDLIHGENNGELGNYSLSVAGMPQIFCFAPDWERKKITINWLKRYSAAFYFSRKSHPEVFAGTRDIMRSYGGLHGRFWLAVGKIEFLIRSTTIGHKIQMFVIKNKVLSRLFRRTGRTLMLGD
jgi:glycosyltransferase involved in cell wall biosynthesis